VSNERILENLALLAREHPNVTVRIPLIPGVNDDEANIDESCKFLAANHLSHVDLLPFHEIAVEKYKRLNAEYTMAGTKPPSADRVLQIADRFAKNGFAVRIGG
jgi:pyruvate formate lyase activating enzyme